MRVVYGFYSQGQGHLSKARTLIPLLLEQGHTVLALSSGPPLAEPLVLPNLHTLHVSGLPYAFVGGRTDYGKTFKNWLSTAFHSLNSFQTVARAVRDFQPDLVISDFEPFSASPLLDPKCEILAVSRQMTLIDPGVPLPEGFEFERKMTRSVIRFFSMGADRRFGYHYHRTTFRCLPPVIDPSLLHRNNARSPGDYFLVYTGYQTSERDPQELVSWASKNRAHVRAYGFRIQGRHGLVEFKPALRTEFRDDLACAKGLLTTAGLTTPLEAYLLRIPCAVVPILSQWEQWVNAQQLTELGLVQSAGEWNYDALLDLEPVRIQLEHEQWLRHTPNQILSRIIPDWRLKAAG